MVIRSIVTQLLPDAELRHLHPPIPATAFAEPTAADSSLGAGWKGVRLWCKRYAGKKLAVLLRGIVGDEYDGLIVHVDASIADKLDIIEKCPPARATTDRLRLVVIKEWLAFESAPPYLMLATPSKEVEAWILAAFQPDRSDLECDLAVTLSLTKELRSRRLLRGSTRSGRLKKSTAEYQGLAQRVGRHLPQVRAACTEAERLARDVESFDRQMG
jgi:hypothetical protein